MNETIRAIIQYIKETQGREISVIEANKLFYTNPDLTNQALDYTQLDNYSKKLYKEQTDIAKFMKEYDDELMLGGAAAAGGYLGRNKLKDVGGKAIDALKNTGRSAWADAPRYNDISTGKTNIKGGLRAAAPIALGTAAGGLLGSIYDNFGEDISTGVVSGAAAGAAAGGAYKGYKAYEKYLADIAAKEEMRLRTQDGTSRKAILDEYYETTKSSEKSRKAYKNKLSNLLNQGKIKITSGSLDANIGAVQFERTNGSKRDIDSLNKLRQQYHNNARARKNASNAAKYHLESRGHADKIDFETNDLNKLKQQVEQAKLRVGTTHQERMLPRSKSTDLNKKQTDLKSNLRMVEYQINSLDPADPDYNKKFDDLANRRLDLRKQLKFGNSIPNEIKELKVLNRVYDAHIEDLSNSIDERRAKLNFGQITDPDGSVRKKIELDNKKLQDLKAEKNQLSGKSREEIRHLYNNQYEYKSPFERGSTADKQWKRLKSNVNTLIRSSSHLGQIAFEEGVKLPKKVAKKVKSQFKAAASQSAAESAAAEAEAAAAAAAAAAGESGINRSNFETATADEIAEDLKRSGKSDAEARKMAEKIVKARDGKDTIFSRIKDRIAGSRKGATNGVDPNIDPETGKPKKSLVTRGLVKTVKSVPKISKGLGVLGLGTLGLNYVADLLEDDPNNPNNHGLDFGNANDNVMKGLSAMYDDYKAEYDKSDGAAQGAFNVGGKFLYDTISAIPDMPGDYLSAATRVGGNMGRDSEYLRKDPITGDYHWSKKDDPSGSYRDLSTGQLKQYDPAAEIPTTTTTTNKHDSKDDGYDYNDPNTHLYKAMGIYPDYHPIQQRRRAEAIKIAKRYENSANKLAIENTIRLVKDPKQRAELMMKSAGYDGKKPKSPTPLTEYQKAQLAMNRAKRQHDQSINTRETLSPEGGGVPTILQSGTYEHNPSDRAAVNAYMRKNKLPMWESTDAKSNRDPLTKHDIEVMNSPTTKVWNSVTGDGMSPEEEAYIVDAKRNNPFINQ